MGVIKNVKTSLLLTKNTLAFSIIKLEPFVASFSFVLFTPFSMIVENQTKDFACLTVPITVYCILINPVGRKINIYKRTSEHRNIFTTRQHWLHNVSPTS